MATLKWNSVDLMDNTGGTGLDQDEMATGFVNSSNSHRHTDPQAMMENN